MARASVTGAALMRALALSVCVFALALWFAPPAIAQTLAELARLDTPDRLSRLIEGAKKEGTLSLYSSATVEDMAGIIASFEKTYGIKVRVWRGSSEDIRQRALTEARAGRHDADVIETAGPDLEALQREGLLQEVVSPTLKEMIPNALRPHREWVVDRLSGYVVAYNTNLVRKADVPKSYADFLDPKWKGKLGIEAEDSGWFMTYAGLVGEQKAIDLFRHIVQANGISVRKGHTLLANLVVSGEVPVGVTVYSYKADQLEHAGAPIATAHMDPLIALTTGVSVARGAQHPHAALLFWEHMLTEGEKILAAQDNMPTNAKVKAPPAGLVLLDPARALDEGNKWTRLFREIFAQQSR